jgi:DNA-binding NtrC family response regulator
MVEEGRFLEDLLHRFGYFRLTLPSLRERPVDISPLFRRFLAEHRSRMGIVEPAGIDPEVCRLLETAPWPMNIRGVKSAAPFAAATSGLDQDIELQHLPAGLIQECHAAEPGRRTLERRTRRLSQLMAALESVGGNLAAAARLLDIHPRTAYKILGRRRELTGNLSVEVFE